MTSENSLTQKSIFTTAVWVLGWLLAIESIVHSTIPTPTGPRGKSGVLSLYFDYGRTIESKLRNMASTSNQSADPVFVAGWISEPRKQNPAISDGQFSVASYGMSFSNQIVSEIAAQNQLIVPHYYAGPGAPASHSYAMYEMATETLNESSPIQILGILASSVISIPTITHATTTMEHPAPFTSPRYAVSAGKLTSHQPLIQSPDELRETLNDPDRLRELRGQLEKYDAYYSPGLFNHDIGDHLSIVRLARRAAFQKHLSTVKQRYWDGQSFTDHPDTLGVLKAILLDFGSNCESRNQLPFVILIQDKGYGDSLYRAFSPTLESAKIPYASTHDIAPASDLSNFVPDGHFTKEANARIALHVNEVLTKAIRERGISPR